MYGIVNPISLHKDVNWQKLYTGNSYIYLFREYKSIYVRGHTTSNIN